MRIVAGIVVAIGLGIALVGEMAVFVRYDDLERQLVTSEDVNAIRDAQQKLSMWPMMALGASIAAVGFLLHRLDGSVRRRRDYTRPDAALRASPGKPATTLWRRHK